MDLVHLITQYYAWAHFFINFLNSCNGVVFGLWATGYASTMVMIAYIFARWRDSRSDRNEFLETFMFTALILIMFPLICVLLLQALPFLLVGAFFIVTGLAVAKLIPMGKKDK